MIRKFYFRDWSEQITYSYEETINLLENTDKEIDHMDKIEDDPKDNEYVDLPF